MKKTVILLSLLGLWAGSLSAAPLECTNWQQNHPEWLWCDDFEVDASLESNYFEVNRAGGKFGVNNSTAFGGTASLRSQWVPGGSEFGNLKFSFGKTPVAPTRYTNQNFENVFWRFYMKTDANWQGQGNKTSRATIFAASNWSQALIAHLWQGNSLNLAIDPASGVNSAPNSTSVITTSYNDFDNLRWLGKVEGSTQVYSDATKTQWKCMELQVKLNTPGNANGEFRFWINGEPEAERTNLNWRSSYTAHGINAIFLENYMGGGPQNEQFRYFDNFVVSTQRIGCAGDDVSSQPIHPPNLNAQQVE